MEPFEVKSETKFSLGGNPIFHRDKNPSKVFSKSHSKKSKKFNSKDIASLNIQKYKSCRLSLIILLPFQISQLQGAIFNKIIILFFAFFTHPRATVHQTALSLFSNSYLMKRDITTPWGWTHLGNQLITRKMDNCLHVGFSQLGISSCTQWGSQINKL